MANLDQTMLNAIVAAVMQQLQTQGGTAAKAAPMAQPVDRLAQKDKALVQGFVRRGIKRDDIKLMDRSNPAADDHNIRPFQGWLKVGRMVRKGQHGVRGLFHVSQTDSVVQAKPAPKGKAKPKLTPIH